MTNTRTKILPAALLFATVMGCQWEAGTLLDDDNLGATVHTTTHANPAFPTSFSLTGCDAGRAEVIRDVVDNYCHAAGRCMAEEARADLPIHCEPVEDWEGNPQAAGYYRWRPAEGAHIHLQLNPEFRSFEDMSIFWWVVAHEIGHAFRAPHTSERGWVMSEVIYRADAPPTQLDASVLCPLAGALCHKAPEASKTADAPEGTKETK